MKSDAAGAAAPWAGLLLSLAPCLDASPARADVPLVDCRAAGSAEDARTCGKLQADLPQWTPDYPAFALRRCLRGWVDLAVTLDRAGRVLRAEVAASEPPGVFDAAALAAVREGIERPPEEAAGQSPGPRTAARVDASAAPSRPARDRHYRLVRRLAFEPLQCTQQEPPRRRLE